MRDIGYVPMLIWRRVAGFAALAAPVLMSSEFLVATGAWLIRARLAEVIR